MHKVGNIGIIANYVSLYIYSFLHNLHMMNLVNVKIDVNRCCKLNWFSSFLMAQ